ncbi:type IV pilus assembly protein PilM [Candidatus Woesebacteria bacterium]|nr:type IV pilus assembly protein PilM [Candidatus Woesebacteria bacterium]
MSVGIDIGNKSIKLVETEKDGNSFKLKASGIVSYKGLSPEVAKEGKELSEISGVIKKLVKEAKVSSKDTVLSLPESQVFSRVVKFPLLTDSEIASAVKWEAEQYIPIPINEAILQHQVIEKREDTSPPQTYVLLVAASKELVGRYAKIIEMSGLKLTAIEPELMSLVRALAPENQTVMIVDFGARSTDIAISKNAMLTFSRSIPTAGDAFTRSVSQGLGIELQQAEEYKKTYGLSAQKLEGKVKTSLDTVFRMVSDEMKKAIHFYINDEKSESPKSVILAGGTSMMPEAASTLTNLLGMEVVVGNPFSKLKISPEAAKSLSGYAPLYSIAVGLSLREE